MSKTLLVVDDDKDLVEMLTTAFTGHGYQVVPAYDGQEGLEKAIELKPDLILLDIQMPKLDGDQMYMTLRSDESTKKIPIIILTGLRTEQEILENKEENTFAKPVSINLLLLKVEEMLKA